MNRKSEPADGFLHMQISVLIGIASGKELISRSILTLRYSSRTPALTLLRGKRQPHDHRKGPELKKRI